MKEDNQDKKLILVIEDEDIVREVIENKLRLSGYEVVTATNGEGALLALEKSPDLIWLDLMLPRMDGFSFLQMIKGNKRFNHIPVVVVTNIDDPKKMKEVFALSVSKYLIKNQHSIGSIIEEIKNVFNQ